MRNLVSDMLQLRTCVASAWLPGQLGLASTSAEKAIGSHGVHCSTLQVSRTQGLAVLSTYCFSQDVFWEGRISQPVVPGGATRQRGGARLMDVALLLQPSHLQPA